MKKFDELSREKQAEIIDVFVKRSLQKAHQGGFKNIRDDIKQLVDKVENKYFNDASGAFCGCSTCLDYLVKTFKFHCSGRIKEIVLNDAQQAAKNAWYAEVNDDVIKV